jgi:hypothetical protein
MDDFQPVSNSALPVSHSSQPVSNSALPVAGEGKNLYIKPINKLIREPITVHPVAGEGMDVSVFLDRFTKSKKQRQRMNPEGQRMTGAPVSNEGMDVLNTLPMDIPSRALRLSTAITGALGITYPGPMQDWNRVTTYLVQQEYSDEAIRNAADLYMSNPNTRKAMLHPDHGAKEFEKAFPYIDQHLKQQQVAQPQEERTEVAQ